MSSVHGLIGLLSQLLFWAWIIYPALARIRQPILRYLPLLALLPLAWLSFGWFGPLSPVAWCWLLGTWRAPKQRLPLPLLLVWTLGGVLLYASALGYLSTDIYAAGYQPHWLLLPILAGALAAAYWDKVFGWGCVLALLLFAMHGLESHNLWDYLLDPLLWLVMVGQLVRYALAKRPKGIS